MARFTGKLAGLAGSETIKREIARVTRLPFASPSPFLEQEDVLIIRQSPTGAQAQHRAIVQTIEMRGDSQAEGAAREHARLARLNLEHILQAEKGLVSRFPALNLVVRQIDRSRAAEPRAAVTTGSGNEDRLHRLR
jgi:GntR family transcriptional regulator of vanillate catabolism